MQLNNIHIYYILYVQKQNIFQNGNFVVVVDSVIYYFDAFGDDVAVDAAFDVDADAVGVAYFDVDFAYLVDDCAAVADAVVVADFDSNCLKIEFA